MNKGRVIIDDHDMDRTLTRIAHVIVERNKGTENLAVVGIRTGGAILAERIKKKLEEIEPREVPLGILDITLYRDDLALKKEQPSLRKTDIPFSIQGKRIVLVDDVLYTGRTIRAALMVLMDLGRAKQIQLAVLVDRGHRELPINPDIVGRNQPTSLGQKVKVYLKEQDGFDEVRILDEPAGP